MPRKWNIKLVLLNIAFVLLITAILIPLSDLRWREYNAALFLVSAAGGVLTLLTGIVLLIFKRKSSRSFLLSAVLLLTYSLIYFFNY